MIVINPQWKANCLSLNPETTKLKQLRWARNAEKARSYLKASHKFQLKNGDHLTEQISVMTGAEAKAINEAYRISFIKEVQDAYPNPHKTRLIHWDLIEKFIS